MNCCVYQWEKIWRASIDWIQATTVVTVPVAIGVGLSVVGHDDSANEDSEVTPGFYSNQ